MPVTLSYTPPVDRVTIPAVKVLEYAQPGSRMSTRRITTQQLNVFRDFVNSRRFEIFGDMGPYKITTNGYNQVKTVENQHGEDCTHNLRVIIHSLDTEYKGV